MTLWTSPAGPHAVCPEEETDGMRTDGDALWRSGRPRDDVPPSPARVFPAPVPVVTAEPQGRGLTTSGRINRSRMARHLLLAATNCCENMIKWPLPGSTWSRLSACLPVSLLVPQPVFLLPVYTASYCIILCCDIMSSARVLPNSVRRRTQDTTCRPPPCS